ncbi:hypothetical protein ACP26L_05680 [Paenibacillus sp. S-38]|uniref:hypothetical protein n=1 Tax=Paenibacillus sp. S-38 TaxID=3416710 RepID=UPI003CF2E3BA
MTLFTRGPRRTNDAPSPSPPALHCITGTQALGTKIDVLNRLNSSAQSPVLNGAVTRLEEPRTKLSRQAELVQGSSAAFAQRALLRDAQASIAFGQEQLAALQEDLPRFRAGLSEASAAVTENMTRFTDAVNRAVPFIRSDLPKVEQRVHEAAD